jgi:hypothetical protein
MSKSAKPVTPPGTPRSQTPFPGMQTVLRYVQEVKQAGDRKLTPYQYILQVAFNERAKTGRDHQPSIDEQLKVAKRYWDKVIIDRNKPEQLQQFKQWQQSGQQLSVPVIASEQATLSDEQQYRERVQALMRTPTILGLLDAFPDPAQSTQKASNKPNTVATIEVLSIQLPSTATTVDTLRRDKMRSTAGAFHLFSNASNRKPPTPTNVTKAFEQLTLGAEPTADSEPAIEPEYPESLQRALMTLSQQKFASNKAEWFFVKAFYRRFCAATMYVPFDYQFVYDTLLELRQHRTALQLDTNAVKFIDEQIKILKLKLRK